MLTTYHVLNKGITEPGIDLFMSIEPLALIQSLYFNCPLGSTLKGISHHIDVYFDMEGKSLSKLAGDL